MWSLSRSREQTIDYININQSQLNIIISYKDKLEEKRLQF